MMAGRSELQQLACLVRWKSGDGWEGGNVQGTARKAN